MLRGYRYFIVAVGLVLAAHHPNAEAQPKQPGAQERSASALENIAARSDKLAEGAERSLESNPCKPGGDQRSSDLCAQWRAADAAADSAWWAAVGGIASAVSTLLVVVAIGLTHQANGIARDTAKRQLRAYVIVTGISRSALGSDKPFQAVVSIKNKGQTPAAEVRPLVQLGGKLFPLEKDSFDLLTPIEDQRKSVHTLGPDEVSDAPTGHDKPFSPDSIQRFMSGQSAIFCFGKVEYVDVFGEKRVTHFRQILDMNMGFSPCEDGNSFT